METVEIDNEKLIDFLYNIGHFNVEHKGDAGLCSIKKVGRAYAILRGVSASEHEWIYFYESRSEAITALDYWSGDSGTHPAGYVAKQ